jgi:hypothetical protein
MDTRVCLPVVENDCVLDGLLLRVGIAATTAAAAAAAPTAATERTARTTCRTETELKTIQCEHIYIYYLVGDKKEISVDKNLFPKPLLKCCAYEKQHCF